MRSVTEALTQIDHAATEKLGDLAMTSAEVTDAAEEAQKSVQMANVVAETVNNHISHILGASDQKALLNLLVNMIAVKIQPAIERRVIEARQDLVRDLKSSGSPVEVSADGSAIRITSLDQLFALIGAREDRRNGKPQG